MNEPGSRPLSRSKNGADARGESPVEVEADLVRLNAQVAAMRAVLVQLLHEIVVAESRLDSSQASLMIEANEQLIVSALEAQTDADTAHGALDEASRVGGLDPLTGLPNRTLLLDRFETAISSARRHGNQVALLFLDLDAFKQINDKFGHASGDQALQLVADCLSSLVRETDTVSRHGGDEFLVLLAEVTNKADALLVADKVNTALAAHSQFGSQQFRLRASIGVSVYPEDGADAKTLIAVADAAMYLAKKQKFGGQTPDRNEPHRQAPTQAHPGEAGRWRVSLHGLVKVEHEQSQKNLRDANESLVLAALGAQELYAAAEEVRRRQAELLAMVVEELGDPFAPIRLAASTLGMTGAEATLLPRAQAVIELQAEKMVQVVKRVLEHRDFDRTELFRGPDDEPGKDSSPR